MVRRRFFAAIVVGGVALTAACSAVADGPAEVPDAGDVATVERSVVSAPPQFSDYGEFVAEYTDAVERLVISLPDGISFPDVPPGEWAADGDYERGLGEITAGVLWRCEWSGVLVEAVDRGDSETMRKALGHLEEWVDLPEVASHVDESLRTHWESDVLVTAREGNFAALRDIADTC